jgi:type IV pilus assembly protein PilW
VNRAPAKGFTLIELMISMVLGLIVVAGVISVLLANKRTYRTNEGLGQVQESARTAFELMARDIRQSGGNGCDANTRTANVLTAGAEWWQTWFGVRGVDGVDTDSAVADGTTPGTRVAGTDSIHVQGIDGAGLPLLLHNAAGATLQINAAATPFVANDILLICDFDHAAIFRASAYDAASRTVTHGVMAGTPGNCSSGLGFPTVCDGASGTVYSFPANSQIGRIAATDWYVGNNGRPAEGGRSLYRVRLDSGGVPVTEEIVSGVTDLQVRYGMNNSDDIVDATGVAGGDWDDINSIFITLTADSGETNVTTDTTVNNGRVQRTFNFLITLRNRVP